MPWNFYEMPWSFYGVPWSFELLNEAMFFKEGQLGFECVSARWQLSGLAVEFEELRHDKERRPCRTSSRRLALHVLTHSRHRLFLNLNLQLGITSVELRFSEEKPPAFLYASLVMH